MSGSGKTHGRIFNRFEEGPEGPENDLDEKSIACKRHPDVQHVVSREIEGMQRPIVRRSEGSPERFETDR